MNIIALFAGLTIGSIFGFIICALLVSGKISDLQDYKNSRSKNGK